MVSTNAPANQAQAAGKATVAASAGTLLEWYDFYLYLNLATVIASRFFPGSHPGAALLFTLGSFAAGIIMRPVGALLFGRRGDRAGRKPAWLMTLTLMGLSTFATGLVPGYDRIGIAAPAVILALRLLQGLAIGGGYGGATVYVAEHSPAHRRGYFTSWIQGSTMAGLLVSLAVILLSRYALDPDRAVSLEKFDAWGWRIPFLASLILLPLAAWFRVKLQESPVFRQFTPEGNVSPDPLKASLAPGNAKRLLAAIFGLTMGQGVAFVTGGLYAQTFLTDTCRIDIDQVRSMVLIALALSTPFYVIGGRWSDRIGRKWPMLGGLLIAVASWALLFREMPPIAGTSGRILLPDKTEIRNSVAFIGRTRAMLRTSATISYFQDGMQVVESRTDTVFADGQHSAATKPSICRTLPGRDFWKIIALLFPTALGIAISLGPAGAFLSEVFPAGTRCTSVSVSHEAGIGIFGGLTAIVTLFLAGGGPGRELAGLWYPTGVGIICLLTGILFLPDRRKGSHLEIAP